MMPEAVNLYDNSYSNYDLEVYRQVRIETYEQDFGQTSWVTKEESAEIPRLLELNTHSFVFEVGCGSGRYALQVAETVGCRLIGVDINDQGIYRANQLARARNCDSQVRFDQCDVSKPLPYKERTFDTVFSNDALCHVPGRLAVLRELWRTMKPGGRILFSDALVIGGMISHQEILTRSSIGYYVFTPPGENERLIEQAGFILLSAMDTTDRAARIAKRWRDAREARKSVLTAAEGERNYEGVQNFLACVYALTNERRLLRFVYLARKPV